jgi:hypothetical protein
MTERINTLSLEIHLYRQASGDPVARVYASSIAEEAAELDTKVAVSVCRIG